MNHSFTILIAERNRHIRDFLKRELPLDGHSVRVADNSTELLRLINGDATLDLLILDLDIPVLKSLDVLRHLQERTPPLPTILYCFSAEGLDPHLRFLADAVLEKNGNIDALRKGVLRVLRHYYPNRFARIASAKESPVR
jgi:CheY-like chemotaxis protein